MNAMVLLRRHPIYKSALLSQVVAFMLTALTDGAVSFLPFLLSAWILFWVGLVLFVRFRVSPTKPELFLARVGPLFIFILMFVIAQYI